MPVMVWDKLGTRRHENGIDRGVLYLPDGSGVPWSGLTNVVEKSDLNVTPIYYDGMRVNEFVTLGTYEASLKAVTYPDELTDFEGIGEIRGGVYVEDQVIKPFALSYRTMVGTDLKEKDCYKIHLIYNVTAIPSDLNYASLSDKPEIVEFEWALSAIPFEIPGFRPTAHMIFDSDELDPLLLADIEEMLYGSDTQDAELIPIDDIIDYMENWYRIKIVDNGDGTWSATEYVDGQNITFLLGDEFRIDGANAVYLDDVTFLISDTMDITDVPSIEIVDFYNGTWQAITEHDILIDVQEDGYFEIKNATVVWLNEYTYQISDTVP